MLWADSQQLFGIANCYCALKESALWLICSDRHTGKNTEQSLVVCLFCCVVTVRKNILSEKQLKAAAQQIPETGESGGNFTCYQNAHVSNWSFGCVIDREGEYKDTDSLSNHQLHSAFSLTTEPKLQQLKNWYNLSSISGKTGSVLYISSNAKDLPQAHFITE